MTSSSGDEKVVRDAVPAAQARATAGTRDGQRAGGKRPITSRDLLSMRFVGDPRLAPDGSRVVWVESWIDAERDRYRSNLFLAPADGSQPPVPFTTGPGIDRAPRWSPDGRWLAFLSDRPLPDGGTGGKGGGSGEAAESGRGRRPQLYLLPAYGGEARLLTRLKEGCGEPVWSPDGRRLAVLVNVHPERGLEAIGDREPGEDDPYRRFNRDVRVITRLRYKLDGVGFFTEHRRHVAILDLGEDLASLAGATGYPEAGGMRRDSRPDASGGRGEPAGPRGGSSGETDGAAGGAGSSGSALPVATVPLRLLTAGAYDVRSIAWMPSGRELVVVTNPDPDADRQPWTDVYLVPCDPVPAEPWDLARLAGPAGEAGPGGAAGRVRKITDSDIDVYEALPSPDGRWIACRGQDARRYRAYSNTHLYLFSVDGRERRCLTAEPDLTVGDESVNDVVGEPGAMMAWAPDSSGLYALVSQRGTVQLYWFGVDGTVRRLTEGRQVLRGLSLDREARRCAFLRLTATEPGDVWVAALPGPEAPGGDGARPGSSPSGVAPAGGTLAATRLSAANQHLLAEVEVVEPEAFTFESDGHVLDGWLIRPVGFEPGKKYPAILQIHGGPMAMYGEAFFHEFQLLAARGYAVFYTNPRGSQGYGQAFCAAIRGDWGNRDYRDLMAFVDAVLARFDFIDPERLGVAGGSYGGYMTNWIVTHTDRFRAAVTMRCVANEHSFFGTSDIGYYDLFDLEVPPWEDPLRYLEMSPLHHIARCRTPLLIMHSEMDLRCPIEQAEQLYTALKVRGVPTEFVRFPGESHGLSRGGKPWHRVYRLDRIVDWFDRYLRPGKDH